MVLVADPAGPDSVSVVATEWTSVEEYRRMLRFSHTLGSLLREILEDSFLAEVCPSTCLACSSASSSW